MFHLAQPETADEPTSPVAAAAFASVATMLLFVLTTLPVPAGLLG